jgi:hypothetical protein
MEGSIAQRDNEELGRVAAAWWTERFGNPPAAAPKIGVDAVDRLTSIMPPVEPPTAAQVQEFREYLEREILAGLGSARFFQVRMDYDPDRVLRGALEAAGFEAGDGVFYLPWKTTMDFEDGQIMVWAEGRPVEHL